MLMYRNDPLWREMNALFNTLTPPRLRSEDLSRELQAPYARWQNTDEALVLTLDVPGVRADDIDVQVHDNALTVAVRRDNHAPEGYEAHRRERTAWNWSRLYNLPRDVDGHEATASLADGVFTLSLPRRPETKPRRITVTALGSTVDSAHTLEDKQEA